MSDATADIRTEDVAYQGGGATLRGYLASKEGAGARRPGVLVVHEWWGLDEYIKRRARMLAGLGYTALAVDMYGEGKVADTPDEAGAAMNAVLGDMKTGTARLKAAYDLLASQPDVDAGRLGAVGYCFGGAMVLHMARIGLDLSAVVSFHGALGSFHQPAPGKVKARVLVCHGGADVLVPDNQVDAFKVEMDAAGVDYRFVSYDNALHGFTNPEATARGQAFGLPLAYDETVDERSWNDMRSLFDEALA